MNLIKKEGTMENFYLNTNENYPELLMFGGTESSCSKRLKQHNGKSVIIEWVNQHCEDVKDYRKVEKYFFDNYSALSPKGVSEEIMRMSLDEGMYILNTFLGNATSTSPFAEKFYDDIKSKKVEYVRASTLINEHQTREQTNNKHTKDLIESMKINGFLENYPIILWINKGVAEIISGHHRVWAAQQVGTIETIPAIYLPEYFDQKTAEDVGWLSNGDHPPAAVLSDKDIRKKLREDIKKHGIDHVKEHRDDYVKMLGKSKSSIGSFISGANKQLEKEKIEELSPFKYDKNQINEEKARAAKENPEALIAMIDMGNWRQQLGGSMLEAMEYKLPKIEIRAFTGKMLDNNIFKAHFKRMRELAKSIERLGMDYNIETIDQTEEGRKQGGKE